MTARRAWILIAVALGFWGRVSVAAADPEGSRGGTGSRPPQPAAEHPTQPGPGETRRDPSPGSAPAGSLDPRKEGPADGAVPETAGGVREPGTAILACLILPLSGPHGAVGTRVLERMKAALAAAAVPRWEVRDDEGTDRGVVEAASWARERRCGVWIGGIGDREARALIREARDQDVPLVGLWSSPTVPDDDRVIGATPDRRRPMEVLARYLKEAGVQRVFLLAGPTAGDRDRAAAFQQAASGIGTILRVEASGDPRASAASLAEAMAGRRAGAACEPEAVVLSGDPGLAVRWKGFLEAEGVIQGRDRCPGPLLAGPPSWATPEALRRYGLALEGAVTAAWRDDEGNPVADPLVPGIRLAVAAVLQKVRSPEGAGWHGLEVRVGQRQARYVAGGWQGLDPALLRLEGGRTRWIDPALDAGSGSQ